MAADFSRGTVKTFLSHFLDFEFVSKLLDCSLNSCTLELFANGAFSMISIFFFLQHENLKSWFGIDLILEGTRSDFDAQQQYLFDVLHFLLSILLVGLVQHVVAPHEASWQSKTEACKTFFCQQCFWLLGTRTAA